MVLAITNGDVLKTSFDKLGKHLSPNGEELLGNSHALSLMSASEDEDAWIKTRRDQIKGAGFKLFGLCLVHAHCELAEGEIMLARGNVTEPEPVSGLTEYFPERWLASGEPYEFTTRPTTAPPAALVEAFKALVGVAGVLGLYHIDKTRDGKWIEHSEGRKNIIQPLTDKVIAPGVTQSITAWDFGSFDPVTLACNKIHVCNTIETKSKQVHHSGIKAWIHGRSK